MGVGRPHKMKKEPWPPLKRIEALLRRNSLSDGRRFGLFFLRQVALMGGMSTHSECRPIDDSEYDILADGLFCVSCSFPLTEAQTDLSEYLFCSETCRQVSIFIRYVRRCIVDGRVWKADIQQDAIVIRLLMLNGGGYARRERKLATDRREAIFLRDGMVCSHCGAPATQIDHVSSHSDAEINLQAVCGPCNREKAFRSAIPATKKQAKAIHRLHTDLVIRITADQPMVLCDRDDWAEHWRRIRGVRIKRLRNKRQRLES